MTAPTEIEFKVTADTSQAQAAVAGLEGEFKKSTGAAAMLDKRIEALTSDLDELSTAIVKGGSSTEAYRAEMARLERQLDALHGVAPRVTRSTAELSDSLTDVAKSGANSGRAILELSRGFEDAQYGIAGVLNNIPSLLAALGAGAGLAGVVSLVAVGGKLIYDNFIKVPEGVDTAVKGSKPLLESLADDIQSINDDIESLATGSSIKLIKARRETEKLEEAAAEAGAAFKARYGDVSGELDTIRSQANGGLSIWLKVWDEEKQQLAQVRVAAKEVVDAFDETLKVGVAVVQARTKANELAAKQALKNYLDEEKRDEKEAEREGKRAVTDAKREEAAHKKAWDAWIALEEQREKHLLESMEKQTKAEKDAEDESYKIAIAGAIREGEALDAIDKERDERRKARERENERERKAREANASRLADRNQRRQSTIEGVNVADRFAFSSLKSTDPEVARIDALTDHEFEALKLRRDRWADFYSDIGGLASSMFDGLISETANLFNALAAGEEKAVESFAVNVMKNAGQSLVASGTKLAGEAVVSALTPGLQPLAAAQLAGAVGLVGAGVGLGASAGALGNILGLNKESAASSRDPGASPRSLGDGGGSGLIVNVSYGVAGPLPEDTAREVQAALEVEGRR